MLKELPVIKCPVCGREYMPGEVFMPNDFFGKQKEVIRKHTGEIDFYVGTDPNFEEMFTCEECGTDISIKAEVSFDVSIVKNELEEFDEEYVTKINKPKKLVLEEVDVFGK